MCARNNGAIFAVLIAIRTAGSRNSYLYEKIGIFGNSPKVPHTQIVKVGVGVILRAESDLHVRLPLRTRFMSSGF